MFSHQGLKGDNNASSHFGANLHVKQQLSGVPKDPLLIPFENFAETSVHPFKGTADWRHSARRRLLVYSAIEDFANIRKQSFEQPFRCTEKISS